MNKQKILNELTKLAKGNSDIGNFGDGYEKAINEAIELVKNCSIPDVVEQGEQLCCQPIEQDTYCGKDNQCPICGKTNRIILAT